MLQATDQEKLQWCNRAAAAGQRDNPTAGAAAARRTSRRDLNLLLDYRHRLLTSRLMLEACLFRQESRGGHFRHDAPASMPQWRRHSRQVTGMGIHTARSVRRDQKSGFPSVTLESASQRLEGLHTGIDLTIDFPAGIALDVFAFAEIAA